MKDHNGPGMNRNSVQAKQMLDTFQGTDLYGCTMAAPKQLNAVLFAALRAFLENPQLKWLEHDDGQPPAIGLPSSPGQHPKISAKACRLFVGDVLLPLLFAFSLPRSEPAHAIAEDALYVPPSGSRHSHR